MRIEGIAAAFPSRLITNEDTVALLAKHSEECFDGDLASLLRMVTHLLQYSGARNRYWCDTDDAPIDFLIRAADDAIEQAGCSRADISMLIHTGVNRGFLEPGSSYMLAHAMGMSDVQCFDLIDACNSWSRAVFLANRLLTDRTSGRILIVNSEFNFTSNSVGYPLLWTLRNTNDLASRFPAYTIREGATATVLGFDRDRDWKFHFVSRPEFADLCTIPNPGYEKYCRIGANPSLVGGQHDDDKRIGFNGVGVFTAFGEKLHEHGEEQLVNVFNALTTDTERIRLVIPHASSAREWKRCAKKVGIDDRLFLIYPDYGNLVSASIPAGIAIARDRGLINPGDTIVVWSASAGMSFCAYSFVF